MSRFGSTPFAFPEFSGATRRLVVWNLLAYFLLALMQLAVPGTASQLAYSAAFSPAAFLHGNLWQPLTYSFVHVGLVGTLFELLSLWFLAGFLENYHRASWITTLYGVSVLGTAAAATVIYACGHALGFVVYAPPLYGCFGGIFGLLAAIGTLYGDTEFILFPLPMGIKARYLMAIYALIALAMLFGQQRVYAFAQLGGALAGLLYIRLGQRRGRRTPILSEQWYGLRNRYYRWKRRRAARKFKVYMNAQGSRLDSNPDDKKHWN